MDDTSIIELYWNRDEQTIAETDKKYGKLCYCLAENILKRREDSEECVSDAFMKVWNSIPDDRPEHFQLIYARS
ncbi:sigma factor [Ruminococcus sp.]|uniref:sigma factor n=1 Tax=Ruminococcus sp. TaxID=41978 RepID=UPI0025F8D249|nr:sigma factor [Ruminococcus sp.]